MAPILSKDNSDMSGVVLFEEAVSGDINFPDGIQNSAADYRMLIDALVSAPGVIGCQVTAIPDANDVYIAPGLLILPEKSPGGGKYIAKLKAQKRITMPAMPTTGPTLTHQIIAYAIDKADGAGTDGTDTLGFGNGWAIDILTDGGSGTTLPAYAISIGKVKRTPGITTILSDAVVDSRVPPTVGKSSTVGGVVRTSTTGNNINGHPVIAQMGGASTSANLGTAVLVTAGHKYAIDVSARVTNDYSTADAKVAPYFTLTANGATFPTSPSEYIGFNLPFDRGYVAQFTMYYEATTTGLITFLLYGKAFPATGWAGASQISLYPPSSIIVRDLGLSSLIATA